MSGVIARTRPSYVSLENKVPGLGTHASGVLAGRRPAYRGPALSCAQH